METEGGRVVMAVHTEGIVCQIDGMRSPDDEMTTTGRILDVLHEQAMGTRTGTRKGQEAHKKTSATARIQEEGTKRSLHAKILRWTNSRTDYKVSSKNHQGDLKALEQKGGSPATTSKE